MSAELLRQAATDIREQSPTGTYGDPCGDCGIAGAFLDAVADWLDIAAERAEYFEAVGWGEPHAMAVARAFLGEDA